MKKTAFLTDPLFLISLSLLLLNDQVLKYTVPGLLSGKLSDIFGLAAFVLFFSSLLPRHRPLVFLMTAAGFLLWKSPLADPLIWGWNAAGFIPLNRTPDAYDLLCLLILPWLWYYRPRPLQRINMAVVRIPLLLMALFAFCSTSYMRVHQYNKEYHLPFPREVIIERLNALNDGCDRLPFSGDFSIADTSFIWGSDTGFVSYTDSVTHYVDTLYVYDAVLRRSTSQIDTIIHYTFRESDTIVIHGSNPVDLSFRAKDQTAESENADCDCLVARIRIRDEEAGCVLVLESVDMDHCYGTYGERDEKKEKAIVQNAFETRVIARLMSAP